MGKRKLSLENLLKKSPKKKIDCNIPQIKKEIFRHCNIIDNEIKEIEDLRGKFKKAISKEKFSKKLFFDFNKFIKKQKELKEKRELEESEKGIEKSKIELPIRKVFKEDKQNFEKILNLHIDYLMNIVKSKIKNLLLALLDCYKIEFGKALLKNPTEAFRKQEEYEKKNNLLLSLIQRNEGIYLIDQLEAFCKDLKNKIIFI